MAFHFAWHILLDSIDLHVNDDCSKDATNSWSSPRACANVCGMKLACGRQAIYSYTLAIIRPQSKFHDAALNWSLCPTPFCSLPSKVYFLFLFFRFFPRFLAVFLSCFLSGDALFAHPIQMQISITRIAGEIEMLLEIISLSRLIRNAAAPASTLLPATSTATATATETSTASSTSS